MAETITSKAKRMAREDGINAAAWYMQDAIDRTRDTVGACQRTLQGIEDGDPEILDTLPWLDLSGQWADGWTTNDVYSALGIEPHRDSDDMNYITTYENAFNDAMISHVETQCRYRLR